DPDNSLTAFGQYTDRSMSGTFGYSLDGARAGRPGAEVAYSPPDGQGNRRMLRRKLMEWSVTGSNATGLFPNAQQYAARNPRVTKEVEILLDTDGSAVAKTTTYDYDLTYQFGVGVEQTSKSEYDYVSIDQTTAQSGDIGSIP